MAYFCLDHVTDDAYAVMLALDLMLLAPHVSDALETPSPVCLAVSCYRSGVDCIL